MLRKLQITISAIIFLIVPVWSVKSSSPYIALGTGANSCGTWTSETRTNVGIENKSWVLGFLTAYNLYGLSVSDNIAAGVNSAGLFAWIDNYCATHPLDDITTALEGLIAELKRKSGAH